MNIVLAKSAICAVCIVMLLITFRQKKRIEDLASCTSIYSWVAGLWLILRLAPFVLIFLILGIEPTSDVNGFWYMATHAAEGKVVYRDFWSPYSPLFSYLLAIGAILWNNPKVIVLITIFMEGVAVVLSWCLYKPIMSRATFCFRSLVYFLLPGSLILSVLGAQEDIWIWLFFTLAVIAGKEKNNIVVYALVLALGVLVTKAIFVLFLFPLFLLEKEKWKFSWPLALVGLVSLLVLYLSVGDAFLQPVGEADTLRAPNLVSVINPWVSDSLGAGDSIWNWLGLIVTVTVGILAAVKWKNGYFPIASSKIFVLMYATLMIVQQSAYSNYIFIFLLPLTLVLSDFGSKRYVSFLIAYNVLCAIHPSYWWRSGMPKYYSVSDIFTDMSSAIDYTMQLSIILLTIGLIWHVFKSENSKTQRIT